MGLSSGFSLGKKYEFPTYNDYKKGSNATTGSAKPSFDIGAVGSLVSTGVDVIGKLLESIGNFRNNRTITNAKVDVLRENPNAYTVVQKGDGLLSNGLLIGVGAIALIALIKS